MINKLARVISKSISAIDHINTNFLLNSKFKSGIIKTNLSDHFAITMTCGQSEKFFKNIKYTRHAHIIYKRIFSKKQNQQFKLKL